MRDPVEWCGRISRTMTAWFVVAIPPLIMFFALAMERLETRLRHVAIHENVAVPENEVAEFLRLRRQPKRSRAGLVRSRTPRQRA